MKTVKLLLLLLIPAALFFASCQNELPEETFFIEEFVYTNGGGSHYHLSDVDYFELNLQKWNPAMLGIAGNNSPDEIIQPYIHLEKGEILRLEGLEPGYYKISGSAYKINEDYNPTTGDEFSIEQVGTVVGKSDRMHRFEGSGSSYIIIDEDSPVIIKLVFFGDGNL